jgi:phage protein D/phage baseplate assembly protein gpV
VTTAFFAPRARIDVSGVTLAAEVSRHVLSVRYDNDVELADMVSVVLDNAGNRFTDSPLFEPGKQVELHLGYGDELRPMMLGEIASVEPSFPQSGAPTLTVSGYDRSYRLRHDVPDRPAFLFTNDSLIATQIALEAGLIPVVDPSPFPPVKSLPRTAPDMALLKERALANFFEVFVHWDKLYFRFPRPQTEAVSLAWGRNLSSFTPRLSHAGLAGMQVVRGYNEDLALSIVGVATTAGLDLDAVLERLGEAGVGALAALGRRVAGNAPVTSPVDASALARALLQDILDGLYEATGSCIGLPDLQAGSYVEVTGVGKRFSGRYRLTKVSHVLDQGGYRTEFEVTQRAGSTLLSLLRKATVDTPPPNRREPITGVVVGTVRTVDPIRYKVGVNLANTPPTDVVEASCTTFTAGPGRGAYFLPEPGDQVLLAFAEGDITRGYVLGSLWSAGPKPAQLPGVQRLRSKAGHTITLDDLTSTIVVEHPAGASITMAADGSVSIGATTGRIAVEAAGDLALVSRTGRITLDAAQGVAVSARSGDVAVTGPAGVAIDARPADVDIRAADVSVTVAGAMDVRGPASSGGPG